MSEFRMFDTHIIFQLVTILSFLLKSKPSSKEDPSLAIVALFLAPQG